MSFLKELSVIIKAALKMLSRGWYNALSERGKKSYETLGYVISKKIIEAVLFVAIMVFTVFAAEGFDNLMKIFNLQKKFVLVLAIFFIGIWLFNGVRLYKRSFRSEDTWRIDGYEHKEILVKRSINFYETILEKTKLKVDIYKSFSPIPILLLFFKDLISLVSDLDNISIDRASLVVIIGIGFYVAGFIIAWDNYDIASYNLLEYRNKLLTLDVANLYEKDKSEDKLVRND